MTVRIARIFREQPAALAISGFVAFLIVLRVFLLEAFKLPSGSMIPGLQVGDHVFALKSAYGVFSHGVPERGDVIVFRAPEAPEGGEPGDFIKRVVGLPGDVIRVEGGRLIINEVAVPSCHVGKLKASRPEQDVLPGGLYVEFLGESSYLIYLEEGHFDRTEGPFVVGAGEVFVMGDNRHNSLDSRAWYGGRGGGVPLANIRGRAALRWLPTNRQSLSVSRARAEDLMDPALTDALAKCLRGHGEASGQRH